jgi:hypothetical protein
VPDYGTAEVVSWSFDAVYLLQSFPGAPRKRHLVLGGERAAILEASNRRVLCGVQDLTSGDVDNPMNHTSNVQGTLSGTVCDLESICGIGG